MFTCKTELLFLYYSAPFKVVQLLEERFSLTTIQGWAGQGFFLRGGAGRGKGQNLSGRGGAGQSKVQNLRGGARVKICEEG